MYIVVIFLYLRLNIHLKPVGLLNQFAYWDHLLKWAETSCDEGLGGFPMRDRQQLAGSCEFLDDGTCRNKET